MTDARLARLGGNTIALVAARVVAALGNLALAAVVADRLGSAGFGTFAALLAGGAVANLAVTFGVDLVVVRAVADSRPDRANTVAAALRLQLVGATAAVAAAGAGVAVFGWSAVILIPAMTLYPMGVTTVASAVLRGAQRMTPIPVAAVAAAVVSLGAAAWLVGNGGDTNGVAMAVGAVAAGQVVAAALLAVRAATVVPVRGHNLGPGSRLRILVRESWVFAAATVATAIMIQGGLIAYEAIAGGDRGGDAGGLAAGLRLTEAARLLPASTFAALFPAMFGGVHRTAEYQRLCRAMVLYAVAAAAGLAVLAPPLSRWVFDDPPDGVAAIRILSLGLVATVFRLRYSFELIAWGRERLVLAVAVIGAVAATVGAVVGAAADNLVVVATTQVVAAAITAAALGRSARQPEAPNTDTGKLTGRSET